MTRLPFPWICLAVVIGHLLHRSLISESVPLILSFAMYLRPGECDGLLCSQLVQPRPLAGHQYQLFGIV